MWTFNISKCTFNFISFVTGTKVTFTLSGKVNNLIEEKIRTNILNHLFYIFAQFEDQLAPI